MQNVHTLVYFPGRNFSLSAELVILMRLVGEHEANAHHESHDWRGEEKVLINH